MSDAPAVSEPKAGLGYSPNRLFVASCLSLISTSVTFAVIGDIMGALKKDFLLSNNDVGQIGGAATWGFTLSVFALGPLCDALGMRLLMRFAFLCHAVGVLLMVSATRFSGGGAFWALFFGALIIALGNGTVEAVCNPLIATIYPDRKTHKLSQFHMWFPGGIVIGGLICYAISQAFPLGAIAGLATWQAKLLVILVPTIIYGILFTGQKFPHTERVQSGVSFGGMIKETLTRPIFLVLLFCMMLTASLELGPNRWVSSVLESGGIPGILVLCYISGLMAILRFFAGPVVHKISNTGVLFLSALLGGLGLFGLSVSSTAPMAFASATVFAVGVCYFWPTMLGTAAERVPKGGALALSLLGGTGMLIVGVVTTPMMGTVADSYLHQELVEKQAQTVDALNAVKAFYPAWEKAVQNPQTKKEVAEAETKVQGILNAVAKTQTLPKGDTAEALRAAMRVAPTAGDAEENPLLKPAVTAGETVTTLVKQADNHGGLKSFQYVAPIAGVLLLIFGVLYLQDRAAGGYKIQRLTKENAH